MPMYFPPGFDRQKALELAGLVSQAYEQLQAFQEDRDWTLAGGARLLAELRYPGGAGTPDPGARPPGATQYESERRRMRWPRRKPEEGLPIGFIAGTRRELFLVFRGTMTTSEWLRDLGIRLTAYPYEDLGRVHDGFLRTYALFRQAILDSRGGAPTGRRLFIAGHSLGAALATLAAADLAATPSRALVVYTFGSPRVGDNTFAAGYNRRCGARTFRIANSSDLVTSLPPPVPLLGVVGGYFTHVDTPVDFTTQTEELEQNHDMGTYVAALEAAPRPRGFLRSLLARSS